jgi:hypothetical protein
VFGKDLNVETYWFDLSSIAKGYAVQEIHEYLGRK